MFNKSFALTIAILTCAVYFSGYSAAATCEMAQARYTYSYEYVNGMTNEHEHVICPKVTDHPRLTVATLKTPLVIKIGTEPDQPKRPEKLTKEVEGRPTKIVLSKQQSQTEKQVLPRTITAYFPFDSHTLSETERKKVINALADMKGREVSVKGYTSIEGSKPYNDVLASKRAEEVAGLLHENRIDPLVGSKGKCCYISYNQESNRRVEITIEAKGE